MNEQASRLYSLKLEQYRNMVKSRVEKLGGSYTKGHEYVIITLLNSPLDYESVERKLKIVLTSSTSVREIDRLFFKILNDLKRK